MREGYPDLRADNIRPYRLLSLPFGKGMPLPYMGGTCGLALCRPYG